MNCIYRRVVVVIAAKVLIEKPFYFTDCQNISRLSLFVILPAVKIVGKLKTRGSLFTPLLNCISPTNSCTPQGFLDGFNANEI